MRRDTGFTLVELLIAISLTGVIMGPLLTALFIGFRGSSEAAQRLSESHDAQLATVFFSGDVQSADLVLPGNVCVAGAPLVAFRWTEGNGSTVVRQASYEVRTEPVTGERQLLRHLCTTPGVVRTTVVAHELAPTTGPAVTCDNAPCVAGSTPARVALTVTTESGYAFTLRGSRRLP